MSSADTVHRQTELRVTRLGHACQLLEIGEYRVLIDPWFTQTPTYYQGEPVVGSIRSLGSIDAVAISHEHYDHCDLDALVTNGFDLDIPLVGPGTVTAIADAKGFRNLRTVEAWDAIAVGALTITGAPGKHGVHEVTFVIQSDDRTVFFGADTLPVPELHEIPARFGHVDLAILPTNGLCIRPMNLAQVVMDAEQAAALTAVLEPTMAIPHHYAFHSGWLGDRLITKGDRNPLHYADAVARVSPGTEVRIVLPGTTVVVP